jgi:hypothetical protein
VLVWYRDVTRGRCSWREVHVVSRDESGFYVFRGLNDEVHRFNQTEAELAVATWPHEYAWLDGGDKQ